ncbi:hypothetical protein IE53DRAFT_386736, partial [Violaceomyces palustris]
MVKRTQHSPLSPCSFSPSFPTHAPLPPFPPSPKRFRESSSPSPPSSDSDLAGGLPWVLDTSVHTFGRMVGNGYGQNSGQLSGSKPRPSIVEKLDPGGGEIRY